MARVRIFPPLLLIALLFASVACDRAEGGKGVGVAKREGVKMTEKATFAAGCFWGVEELFRNTKGVTATAVGYTGGRSENPTYEEVCSDRTGHAEAVEIEFDPSVISYDELLDIFWRNHDPTTPNRQGLDIGSQYRSAIFYHDDGQRRAAERSRESQRGNFKGEMVTEIAPAGKFWRAEEYHQKYLMKKGAGACGAACKER